MRSNCFTFVLFALQWCRQYTYKSETEFLTQVVTPSTREAARYIAIYRKVVHSSGIYLERYSWQWPVFIHHQMKRKDIVSCLCGHIVDRPKKNLYDGGHNLPASNQTCLCLSDLFLIKNIFGTNLCCPHFPTTLSQPRQFPTYTSCNACTLSLGIVGYHSFF